ncbi:hypothetical protein Tco_0845963 [Tanacetum coccineum]
MANGFYGSESFKYASVSHNSVSSDVVDESCVPSNSSINALTEEIVAYENESDETHAVKSTVRVMKKTRSPPCIV